MRLSVIVPAHQEASCIKPCIDSLISQTQANIGGFEIVVVANGCRDETAALARGRILDAASRNINLLVVEDPIGGKARALDTGDSVAVGDVRVYLDADVRCEPDLLRQIIAALAGPLPLYASGTLTVSPSRSWFSRHYSRVWQALPFVANGVPGCGLYAVNAAGRLRWGRFPSIHSDDKYVRLLFSFEECRRVEARYFWPVPDGLANILRVRRRWCEGNRELRSAFPQLKNRYHPTRWRGYAQIIWRQPISLAVFTAIYGSGALVSRIVPSEGSVLWRRGR